MRPSGWVRIRSRCSCTKRSQDTHARQTTVGTWGEGSVYPRDPGPADTLVWTSRLQKRRKSVRAEAAHAWCFAMAAPLQASAAPLQAPEELGVRGKGWLPDALPGEGSGASRFAPRWLRPLERGRTSSSQRSSRGLGCAWGSPAWVPLHTGVSGATGKSCGQARVVLRPSLISRRDSQLSSPWLPGLPAVSEDSS